MNAPTFLDLFSGAGGLSLGLQLAGWVPVGAVDHWQDAIRTYRRNFPEHPALNADIGELTSRDLRRSMLAHPDWVVGGPPCQGFSTVGRRDASDPRNRMFLEFRRIVRELHPSGFLLENVLGMRDMRFVPSVVDAFAELGYEVSFHVLRAADYGVPQLRRRVIFVGSTSGMSFLGPIPTASGNPVSVWDAVGDLPALLPGEEKTEYDKDPITTYQIRMREGSERLQGHAASAHPASLVRAISFIPDGGNRRNIPDELQPRSGFHNSYSRLASWLPAVAVTSNLGKPSGTRCIHPFQDRGLTAREGARLQSFPDRFWVEGGLVSQRLQVANAVPPLVAEAIGRGIQDGSRWVEGGVHPTVDDRGNPILWAGDEIAFAVAGG